MVASADRGTELNGIVGLAPHAHHASPYSERVIRSPAQRRSGLSWPVVALVLVLALALVAVLSIVRTDPPSRPQPLQISTSEWLPYISPDLPDDGPVAQLLTEVFGRAGYTPIFSYSTWPLAEQEVRSGSSVGMAPVIISDTRDSFALYTEPLMEFRYTLFGRKGELLDSIPAREDLSGLRVARIEGYQYWDALDESGAEFSEYPTALEAFNALSRGEVDLVAEGSLAGQTVLDGSGFSDDSSLYAEVEPATEMTSSVQGLHLLLNDSSEGKMLQKQLNEAIESFRGTADYEHLMAQLVDTSTHVELRAPGGGGVEVLDAAGDTVGVTPTGTRAVVEDWPEGRTTSSTLVPLKILDGPLAGRFLAVRMDDLEITHA